MIRDARFHRGGYAQRLMDAAEVVVHEMQRDGVRVVLDLLAEPVGQPCEAAHGHAHGQILAFNVGCRNIRLDRIASDLDLLGTLDWDHP